MDSYDKLARQNMELPQTVMEAMALEIAQGLVEKFQQGDLQALSSDTIDKVEEIKKIYPNLGIVLRMEVPEILWNLVGTKLTPLGKMMAIRVMIHREIGRLPSFRSGKLAQPNHIQ